VSAEPERSAAVIRAHVDAVMGSDVPRIGLVDGENAAEIIVSTVPQIEAALERLARGPSARSALLLVERGLAAPAPTPILDARRRAHAAIFETAFNIYHARPWSARSRQRLPHMGCRNAIETYLPSVAALVALHGSGDAASPAARATLVEAIATRFAVNTVSVYDWLTGIPTSSFEKAPLRELAGIAAPALCEAVRPFVGTLKKQYRMHASLSRVPRDVFYFGEALLDGCSDEQRGCRVELVQVEQDSGPAESNAREADKIIELLRRLNGDDAARLSRPEVMVITPYRKQEALLADHLGDLARRHLLDDVDVHVCTLDRCQGREAEYVLISLVRARSNPFLDMPKRWNVALTRAKKGQFIVGDVEAYRMEAARARRELAGGRGPRARWREDRPRMSVLARVIEAYHRQIVAAPGATMRTQRLKGEYR
jgi:hypothetical protein